MKAIVLYEGKFDNALSVRPTREPPQTCVPRVPHIRRSHPSVGADDEIISFMATMKSETPTATDAAAKRENACAAATRMQGRGILARTPLCLFAFVTTASASTVDDVSVILSTSRRAHERDVQVLLEALRKYAPSPEVAAVEAQLSPLWRNHKSRWRRFAKHRADKSKQPANSGVEKKELAEPPSEPASVLRKPIFVLAAIISCVCLAACMWMLATDAISYSCLRQRYGWDL